MFPLIMKHVGFKFVFIFSLINVIYSLQANYDYLDESFADLQVNDSSCVFDDGEEGECKRILECPAVSETFHFEDPVFCESFADEALVCCPMKQSSPMVMRRTRFLPPLENLRKPASFDAFECGFSEKYVGIHFNGKQHLSAAQPVAQTGRRKKRWVVGGKESDPGEFPWMALVGKIEKDGKIKWICDGVLIHPKWILTAAHCLLDSIGYQVRLGEHNITSNTEPFQQDLNVTKMIFYPDYKYGINYHDLALAKISPVAKLSDAVMPICLPWKPDLNLVGKTATLAGWGAEMFGGRQSNVLRDVDVTIFANSFCDTNYRTLREYRTVWPSGINNNYIICAGGKEGGIDSCEGDSGGPLVRKRKDKVVLVGLVSRGFGCGLKDFPGIYVAVRTYLIWICDSILQDYLSSG